MAQNTTDPRPDSTDELEAATPAAVDFEHNGVFRDVTHAAGDGEAGFDYSRVDVAAFEDLLDRFDLPDSPTGFQKFLDDMGGKRLLWANDNVALVTTANPITGKRVAHATPDETRKGWTGGVTIMGDSETVKSLYCELNGIIRKTKGKSPEWGWA